MKKLLVLFIIINSSVGMILGQVPDNFRYQAVVRDPSGEIVADKMISIRISILSGSALGNAVYTEFFHYTTNRFGIVAVNIGEGTTVQGNFSAIDWGGNSYYIQIEIDIDGGENYQYMGASQILAVPYALHALDVTNKDDADADPSNEIQSLTKSGNTISLSGGGGSVTDEINDADSDPLNEIQDLVLNDDILRITGNVNATPISLSAYQGTNTDEQILSTNIVGNVVELTIGGGTGGNSVNIELPDDFVSRQNGGTFSGSIFAANLGGTNTGDMSNADVVNAYQSGFSDYFATADRLKLDGIENNATADMANGEIVSAYQNGYPGYFNSTDRTKFNSIESGATADMTNSEIVVAYDAGFPEHFDTQDRTKINHLNITQDFTVSGGHTVTLISSGSTSLNIPPSGTLATRDWVAANSASNSLSTGRILVGEAGVATELDVRGDGEILIGYQGSTIRSQSISGDATLLNTGELRVNRVGDELINLGGSFTTEDYDITLRAFLGGSDVFLPQDGTLANQAYVNTQITSNNSTYTGSNTIVTVGTIGTGVWDAGAITSSGAIEGTSLIRSGGLSTQFLKADGSVDSNTYLTSASGVSSISGTANQITVSGSTGNITLSLPSTINGLTSVTSTGFTGALTGNASTATMLETGRTISISGDLTYTSTVFDGSGNVTGTGILATVNANTGSFGDASLIPAITVNEKGLVTAVSTNTVIAPAGTLTGTSLSSSVVSSSLTSVGIIGTGVWRGTDIESDRIDWSTPEAIGATTANTGSFTTLSASGVFKAGQFTAVEASALTPANGDFIYVTTTNTTFTSVGFWGYENNTWNKL